MTWSTLSELFEAIGEKLNARRSSGDPKVSIGIGGDAAAEFKAPPNVVFAPTQGKGGKPRANGYVSPQAGGGYTTVDEPRVLWERGLQIACRVYGEDLDDCNEIGEQLANAFEDAVGGNYTYEGEEWDTSGKLSRGLVLVMFFRIAARWNRTEVKLVTPTTMEETFAIETELSS